MGIPGLSSIKTWGMIALGFALSVVYALLQMEKADRAAQDLAISVKNRKIQAKVIKEINKGLNNETKVQNDPVDPNYFS